MKCDPAEPVVCHQSGRARNPATAFRGSDAFVLTLAGIWIVGVSLEEARH